ncbi:MAG: hypothetical protein Harvfovirus79_2 [Harvfovirus sp.]|uniref:Uncharacterized protein n=1 Tax=Harvfovirus sp. TaxID=2487768 RepID=A0A3G5A7X4_9VIRU|nr:MAG: hypothetical protein Harvfovirus79_2 [Harvfovirus sp.]
MSESTIDVHYELADRRASDCRVVRVVVFVCVIALLLLSIGFSAYKLVTIGDEYDMDTTTEICRNYKSISIMMTTADVGDLLSIILFMLWIYKGNERNSLFTTCAILLIIYQLIEYGFAVGIVSKWTNEYNNCIADKGVQLYFSIHNIIAIIRTMIGSMILLILLMACIASIF